MLGARLATWTDWPSRLFRRPARALTIRQLLLLFFTAIMAPLLTLLAFTAYNFAEAQRTNIRTEQRDVTNNLSFLVEREIEGVKGALQALATSPELQTGHIEDFRPHLASASAIRTLNSLAVVDASGQVLLSTAAREGQPLPKRSDFEFLPAVFAGETAVSGYSIGAVTNTPIFMVAVPIRIDTRIQYALVAGIQLVKLNSLFAEAQVKAGWLAVIMDSRGVLLARNLAAERYIGQMGRPDVVAAIKANPVGTVLGRTREGIDVSNRFVRSGDSGWTSLIAVPLEALDAPLRNVIWSLGLFFAAVIGLTLLASTALARWISQPLGHLKRSAIQVLDGQSPPASLRNTIAELEEVDKVFRFTASISADRKKLQEKLQQAVDVASIGIFERDHQTNSFELSPALVDMLGLDSDSTTVPIAMLRGVIVKEDLPTVVDRARKALNDPDTDGQFVSETRIQHPKRGLRWLSVRASTQFDNSGGFRQPVKTIGAVRDITERKKIEEDLRLLTRELAHRSKNLLAIVQAMAGQTARSVGASADFQRIFSQRIMSLAASIDVLVSREWSGALMTQLVRRQLQPFVASIETRLIMDRPDVLVGPQAVQALGLALHELATNSVKYGALSQPAGKIEIDWVSNSNDEGEPGLLLSWRERGGPPVTPPEHKGFGNVVMDRMVAQAIGGKVVMNFAVDGLVWTLWMPARHVSSAGPAAEVAVGVAAR